MSFQSKFEGTHQNVWDPSSIASFRKCPQYYKLSYLDNWTSKHPPAYLPWGTAWHAMLETWYKLRAQDMPQPEARIEVIKELLLKYRDFVWDEGDNAHTTKIAVF